MKEPRSTSRREFLQGRSALEALENAVDAGVQESLPVSSTSSSPAEAYLVQVERRAMACNFAVIVNAGQFPQATEEAVHALDLVEALEAQLTVYRDTSEVMQLNRTAALDWVDVEPRLFGLLQLAARLHAATNGAFDIAAGRLIKAWGFYRRQGSIPTETDLHAALELVGMQYLVFDSARPAVRFDRAGLQINLGAIGKGYALDRVAESLESTGVDHFLLHGGQSSIVARGHAANSGRGWPIGIPDPLRPGKRLAEIFVRDQALGTSGASTQFFRHEGRRYGHILDPRTGWPAQNVLSATVVAPSGAEADALATAFYVMGVEAARAYCESHSDIAAVIVGGTEESGLGGVHTFGLAEQDFRWLD